MKSLLQFLRQRLQNTRVLQLANRRKLLKRRVDRL